MQGSLGKKYSVLNNRTESVINCFFIIWLITFTRNAIYAPGLNVNLLVSIGIGTRGKSRLNIGRTFVKQAIPMKNTPTRWSTDIPWLCRTCHFRWKGEYAYEIQLLSTAHEQRRCHQANGLSPVQFDFTRPVPPKKWHVHICEWKRRRLRYLQRLRTDMSTQPAIALDSSFMLHLIHRI